MLQLNRVKVEILTENGVYGCDIPFSKGLNFLASEENTCGKSSVLAAIYYCLGMEEIIGGRGEKVLTSVFKNTIEDDTKQWSVLQSCAYLEISNGVEIVTLFRSAKMANRDSRMITIYYGAMDDIDKPTTMFTDTYVHFPNAAERNLGFHSFLEKFLHLELPRVSTSDDKQRKLYLQLIFSCMFIEQKHGWSGLFSGMPILGVKESKKRVIEFILKLDTLENDRLMEKLRKDEYRITQSWNELYSSLQKAAQHESCLVSGFPLRPRVLSDSDTSRIAIKQGERLIPEIINDIEEETIAINRLKPKVVDNFDSLQSELKETEDKIVGIEEYILACKKQLAIEEGSIKAIRDNLDVIAVDLSNNKDAARLRTLGSDFNFEFADNKCPVCHQSINGSLLPVSVDIPVMGIDENIRHLEAQQEMLKFSLESRIKHREELENTIQSNQSKLFTLRRLAQSIRNDLYSVDEDYSEAIIYKKITLEKQIESLSALQQLCETTVDYLVGLSNDWKKYLEEKKRLPKDKFTVADKEKLKLLRQYFIDNLKSYGYKSVQNLHEITISNESYLPLFEGFDMKFDSSASDGIRVIWAFTMALLQVSLEKSGNHPAILILDEPDQQSTIISDMKAFFDSILRLDNRCQVIIGITLKDSDTKKAIQELPQNKYVQYNISKRAFTFLRKNPIE